MLRIIGGQFKNRSLKTPKGAQTRPTSALVRKAVFDICRNLTTNARFLDLFAGTGAMGIEALSRGALSCTFVENDRFALKSLHENIALFKLKDSTTLLASDVIKSLKLLYKEHKEFDLIYVDPPYTLNPLFILEFLDEYPLLAKEGILFIEQSRLSAFHPDKFLLKNHVYIEKRKFGNTLIHLFTRFESNIS